MEFFYLYLVSAVIALMGLYAVMRWIDYAFTKREDRRRFCMAKSFTKYALRETGIMGKDLITEINNNVFENARKMMGEDL